jgi:hypothetical protein
MKTSSFQWTGYNIKEIKQWLKNLAYTVTVKNNLPNKPTIKIEGDYNNIIFVKVGEYIVRSDKSVYMSESAIGHMHDSNLVGRPKLDNDRVIATMLAALRFMQVNMDDDILEMKYFEDVKCLESDEIDQLCQDINYGDLTFKV